MTQWFVPLRTLALVFAGTLIWFSLGGCASRGIEPEALKLDYTSRAISRSDGGVRVSTRA